MFSAVASFGKTENFTHNVNDCIAIWTSDHAVVCFCVSLELRLLFSNTRPAVNISQGRSATWIILSRAKLHVIMSHRNLRQFLWRGWVNGRYCHRLLVATPPFESWWRLRIWTLLKFWLSGIFMERHEINQLAMRGQCYLSCSVLLVWTQV